jgi:hypothetical protein
VLFRVEAVGCRIIVGARWRVGGCWSMRGRLDDLALVLPQPGLLLRRTTAPPAARGLVDPAVLTGFQAAWSIPGR